MTSRTLWIPATDLDEARHIGNLAATGRCGHVEHYQTAEGAQRIADHLNRLAERDGRPLRRGVFKVEVRAVDDGRIANVWPADQVGDAAAALFIVIGGCFAVGLGTLL